MPQDLPRRGSSRSSFAVARPHASLATVRCRLRHGADCGRIRARWSRSVPTASDAMCVARPTAWRHRPCIGTGRRCTRSRSRASSTLCRSRRCWRPSGTRPDPDDPARQLPFYRVAMREAEVQVHRDLPPTRVWGYDGRAARPDVRDAERPRPARRVGQRAARRGTSCPSITRSTARTPTQPEVRDGRPRARREGPARERRLPRGLVHAGALRDPATTRTGRTRRRSGTTTTRWASSG